MYGRGKFGSNQKAKFKASAAACCFYMPASGWSLSCSRWAAAGDQLKNNHATLCHSSSSSPSLEASLLHWRHCDVRARALCTLAGYERGKYCTDAMTHLAFGLTRALFPQLFSIKETLDDGTHAVFLEKNLALDKLIGADAKKRAPETYAAPLLDAVTADKAAHGRLVEAWDEAAKLLAERQPEQAPAVDPEVWVFDERGQ